jgi:hypothetical protein
MNNLRSFMIIFGGILFLMSALNIVRLFARRPDIWWTPQALSVPLAEASDRVRVYTL